MNILSRILKEIALEFQIPEEIDKKLLQRILGQRKNKQKGIMEKTDNGRTKKFGDKGASG